jgi:DNA-binding Lrp family transcriptional regulator
MDGMMDGVIDKELLMELQYSFPLNEDPFVEVAERLGRSVQDVISSTIEMLNQGIILRIGVHLNYKAFREISRAALVGAAVEEDRIEEVARKINGLRVKHNFWRSHPRYTVWYTIKAPDDDALVSKIDELMRSCGVKDYVVLPSKRVYKMDVKYHLYKGVSWSEKGLEPESIPKVDELGVNAELLRKLESNFPVSEKPFSSLSKEFEMSESEIVELVEEMIRKGVARGFNAVLSGERAGFKENGMVVVKTTEPEELAFKLLKDVPEITHLVERQVPENWNYPLYFMVHATSKEPIEQIQKRVESMEGVEETDVLYSIRNLLKVGV